MGYYNGSAMSMRGSYCIHYGVKGMKWYQNIFGGQDEATGKRARGLVKDFGLSVKSGYRGAKNASNGGFASYTNKDADGKTSYQVYGVNNVHAKNYDDAYGRTIANVGSFIGATGYNATVVARRIGEAAKTSWNEVKRTGRAAFMKGRDFIYNILGLTPPSERIASKLDSEDMERNNSINLGIASQKMRDAKNARFEERQASNADRSASISAKNRAFNDRQAANADRSAAISSNNRAFNERQASNADRSASISAKNRAFNDRQTANADRSAAISSNNRTFNRRQEANADRSAIISSNNRAFNRRQASNADRSAIISSNNRTFNRRQEANADRTTARSRLRRVADREDMHRNSSIRRYPGYTNWGHPSRSK